MKREKSWWQGEKGGLLVGWFGYFGGEQRATQETLEFYLFIPLKQVPACVCVCVYMRV